MLLDGGGGGKSPKKKKRKPSGLGSAAGAGAGASSFSKSFGGSSGGTDASYSRRSGYTPSGNPGRLHTPPAPQYVNFFSPKLREPLRKDRRELPPQLDLTQVIQNLKNRPSHDALAPQESVEKPGNPFLKMYETPEGTPLRDSLNRPLRNMQDQASRIFDPYNANTSSLPRKLRKGSHWDDSALKSLRDLYEQSDIYSKGDVERQINAVIQARLEDEQNFYWNRVNRKTTNKLDLLYKAKGDLGSGQYDTLQQYQDEHPNFSLEVPSFHNDFKGVLKTLEQQKAEALENAGSLEEQRAVLQYYDDPYVGIISHYKKIKSGNAPTTSGLMSYKQARQKLTESVRKFRRAYKLEREDNLDSDNEKYREQAEAAPENPLEGINLKKPERGGRKPTKAEVYVASLLGEDPHEWIKRLDEKRVKSQQKLTDNAARLEGNPADPLDVFSLSLLSLPEGVSPRTFVDPDEIAKVDDKQFDGRLRKARQQAKKKYGLKVLPSTETLLEQKAAYGELDLDDANEVRRWIARFENPNHPETRIAYLRWAMQTNPALQKDTAYQQKMVDWANEPIKKYQEMVLIPSAEAKGRRRQADAEYRAKHADDGLYLNDINDIDDHLNTLFPNGLALDSGNAYEGEHQFNILEKNQTLEGPSVTIGGELFWTLDKVVRPLQYVVGSAMEFYGLDEDTDHSWFDSYLGGLTGANPLNSIDEFVKDPMGSIGRMHQGGKQNFQKSMYEGEHPKFSSDLIQANAERNPQNTIHDKNWYQHTAGFGLDVLLDPTSYIGVGLFAGAVKGISKLSKVPQTARLAELASAEYRSGMSWLNPNQPLKLQNGKLNPAAVNDFELMKVVDPEGVLPEAELNQAMAAFKRNLEKDKHWVVPRKDVYAYEQAIGRELSEADFRAIRREVVDGEGEVIVYPSSPVPLSPMVQNIVDGKPLQLELEAGPVGKALQEAEGITPAVLKEEVKGFTVQKRLLRNDLGVRAQIEYLNKRASEYANEAASYVPQMPEFDLRIERVNEIPVTYTRNGTPVTQAGGQGLYGLISNIEEILKGGKGYSVRRPSGGDSGAAARKASERYASWRKGYVSGDDNPYRLLPADLSDIDDLNSFLAPEVPRQAPAYSKPIDPSVGEINRSVEEATTGKVTGKATSLEQFNKFKETVDLDSLVTDYLGGSVQVITRENVRKALEDGIITEQVGELRKLIAKAMGGKHWQRTLNQFPASWTDETIVMAFINGPYMARQASEAVAQRYVWANGARREAYSILNASPTYEMRQHAMRLVNEANRVLNLHRVSGALMYLEDVYRLEKDGKLVSDPSAYANLEALAEKAGDDLTGINKAVDRQYYDDEITYQGRTSLDERLYAEEPEPGSYVDHEAEDAFEASLKRKAELRKKGNFTEAHADAKFPTDKAVRPDYEVAPERFDFDDPDFDLAQYDYVTLSDPENTGKGYQSREDHLGALLSSIERRKESMNLVGSDGVPAKLRPIESRTLPSSSVGKFANPDGSFNAAALNDITYVQDVRNKKGFVLHKELRFNKNGLTPEEVRFARDVVQSVNDRARHLLTKPDTSISSLVRGRTPRRSEVETPSGPLRAPEWVDSKGRKRTSSYGFAKHYPEGFNTKDDFLGEVLDSDGLLDLDSFYKATFTYNSPMNAMFTRNPGGEARGVFDGKGWQNVEIPDYVKSPHYRDDSGELVSLGLSRPGPARAKLMDIYKERGLKNPELGEAIDKTMREWSDNIASFMAEHALKGKTEATTVRNSLGRIFDNSLKYREDAAYRKAVLANEGHVEGARAVRVERESAQQYDNFSQRYESALLQAKKEILDEINSGKLKGSEAAMRIDRIQGTNPEPLPMDRPRMTPNEIHSAQIRAIRQDIKILKGTSDLKAMAARQRGDKQAVKQFEQESRAYVNSAQKALAEAAKAKRQAVLVSKALDDEFRVVRILEQAKLPVKVSKINLYTSLVGKRAGLANEKVFLDEAANFERTLPMRIRTWFGDEFIRPTKQLRSYEAKTLWAQYTSYLPFLISTHIKDLNKKMGQVLPEHRIAIFNAIRTGTPYNGIDAGYVPTIKQSIDEVMELWNYNSDFYRFPSLAHDGSYTHISWDEISRFLPRGMVPDQRVLTDAMSSGQITVDDLMRAIEQHPNGNPGLLNDPYTFVRQMRLAADQARQARALIWGIEDTFGHMRKFRVDGRNQLAFLSSPIEALKDEGYKTIPNDWFQNRAYFHPDIVNDVAKLSELLFSEDARKQLTKLFDEGLGIWKQSVTLLNPGYYTRNAVGEMMVAWLDGLNDPRWYRKANKALKYMKGTELDNKALVERWSILKGVVPVDNTTGNTMLFKARSSGEVISVEQGIRLYHELGLSSTFVNTDLERSLRSVSRGAYNDGLSRKWANAGEKLHEVGEHFEDTFRMGHFFFALEQELRKTSNIKTASERAARRVTRSHFDYADLSTFEKVVMKRIFPFYTWTRKAIPLMVAHLFMTPGKMTAYPKAMDAISNTLSSTDVEDDHNGFMPNYDGLAPQWVVDLIAYQMGDMPGDDDEYANYFRMSTPQMDALTALNNPWDQAGLPLLNPVAKLAIENPVFGMNTTLDPDFNYPIAGGEMNEMNGISDTEATALWAARTLNPITGFLAKLHLHENTKYGEYTESEGRNTQADFASFATGLGFYQGVPRTDESNNDIATGTDGGPSVGQYELSELPMLSGRAAPKLGDVTNDLGSLSGFLTGGNSGSGGSGSGWRNFNNGWTNYGGRYYRGYRRGGGYGGSNGSGFDLWSLLMKLKEQIDQGTVIDE